MHMSNCKLGIIQLFLRTQVASLAASLIFVSGLALLSGEKWHWNDFLGMSLLASVISLVILIFVYIPIIRPIHDAIYRTATGSILFMAFCGAIGWGLFATMLFVLYRQVDFVSFVKGGLWFALMVGALYGAAWGWLLRLGSNSQKLEEQCNNQQP